MEAADAVQMAPPAISTIASFTTQLGSHAAGLDMLQLMFASRELYSDHSLLRAAAIDPHVNHLSFLEHASANGRAERLKALVAAGFVGQPYGKPYYPMARAFGAQSEQCCRALWHTIQNSPDIQLRVAARFGWLPEVQAAVQAGADLTDKCYDLQNQQREDHRGKGPAHVAFQKARESGPYKELEYPETRPSLLAIRHGHGPVVRFLAEQLSRTDAGRQHIQQGATLAGELGNIEMLTYLLEAAGPRTAECRASALVAAASHGHTALIDHGMAQGWPMHEPGMPNIKGDGRYHQDDAKKRLMTSPIIAATAYGQLNIVRLLRRDGMQPRGGAGSDTKPVAAHTAAALVCACLAGLYDEVQAIVQGGVPPHVLITLVQLPDFPRDNEGKYCPPLVSSWLQLQTKLTLFPSYGNLKPRAINAYQAACAGGHVDIMKTIVLPRLDDAQAAHDSALAAASASATQSPRRPGQYPQEKPIPYTLLDEAVAGNSIEAVRLLLESGMPVNHRSSGLCEGLLFAALHRSMDMTKLLVQHGARMRPSTFAIGEVSACESSVALLSALRPLMSKTEDQLPPPSAFAGQMNTALLRAAKWGAHEAVGTLLDMAQEADIMLSMEFPQAFIAMSSMSSDVECSGPWRYKYPVLEGLRPSFPTAGPWTGASYRGPGPL